VGDHPTDQTEWWYYTGNLDTVDGRHFGRQFTIFRSALVPPEDRQQRPSSWGTDQIYMAHFAVTDVDTGLFFLSTALAAAQQALPVRKPSLTRFG
jgi:predicted secreted hydrolase